MHWLTKMLSSLKSEKKQHIEQKQNESPPLSLEYIKKEFQNIHDAKTIEIHNDFIGNVTLFYIRSLVDVRQLQEFVIFPLQHASDTSLRETVSTAEVNELNTLEKAKQAVLKGSVILHVDNRLWSITLPNSISRAIETSEQESIIYGPKDSFSEQIDQNLTLIRRRLPISSLKSEELTIGSMSATTVILLYIDGLTNPELIQIAREKTMSIQYDTFLDTSHFAHFLEDHNAPSTNPLESQGCMKGICKYFFSLIFYIVGYKKVLRKTPERIGVLFGLLGPLLFPEGGLGFLLKDRSGI